MSRDRNKVTVATREWNVSYNTSSDRPGEAVLKVFKIDYDQDNQWGGKGVVIEHELYGRVFKADTRAEAVELAQDCAFEAGVIKYYEPERTWS